MNTKAKRYSLFIILSAFALIPGQDWSLLLNTPNRQMLGILAFIGLAVFSDVLSLAAVVGRHRAASSIGFIPLFACVLLFPPPAALFATFVTSFIGQAIIHKRPPFRAMFNIAQSIIAIVLANAVYIRLGGVYGVPLNIELVSFRGPISLIALAITFFVINQVLVSVAIALMNGDRVATVVNNLVAPAGANLLYDVIASAFAFVVAVLFSSFGVPGLLLGVLPLYIIRHSYESFSKLEQVNKDLLSVLVKTIETRDPYTSGHSIRVSILARAIAEDMNLSGAAVDRIEMAGLVHDIGKIDLVYATIIQKEGGLTDHERKIIVTHAAKGAEFLETLTSFRADVIRGVRHHHERYDGTGYPDQLRGEEIPLAARIIMLCDSIDAMLSDRPYRKALSIEHVRSELVRCSHTQFDPRIVEVILKRNTLERAAALVRPEALALGPRMVATA